MKLESEACYVCGAYDDSVFGLCKVCAKIERSVNLMQALAFVRICEDARESFCNDPEGPQSPAIACHVNSYLTKRIFHAEQKVSQFISGAEVSKRYFCFDAKG